MKLDRYYKLYLKVYIACRTASGMPQYDVEDTLALVAVATGLHDGNSKDDDNPVEAKTKIDFVNELEASTASGGA